jgi:thiamine biosynthesis lipoprotein
VTVAASSCVDANVASTAAVVLGEDAPRWLAARGLAARLVRDTGEVAYAGGWPEDPA